MTTRWETSSPCAACGAGHPGCHSIGCPREGRDGPPATLDALQIALGARGIVRLTLGSRAGAWTVTLAGEHFTAAAASHESIEDAIAVALAIVDRERK